METRQVVIRSGCAVLALAAFASAPVRAEAGEPRIAVSFKLDPRLTKSLYMGERWVSPPTYASATAPHGTSITVDARAHAVDASGRPHDVVARWIPSDPEMVTVSPGRGSDVRIRVRRAGRTTLQVIHGGASRELTLETVRQGTLWRVDISQRVAGPAPQRGAAGPTAARRM